MSDITFSKTGMSLTLADGRPGYVNYFWLRDNCPTSFDPGTHERIYEIRTAPDDLHPLDAHVADGALHVTWSDGNHRSRYDLAWLTEWIRRPGRDDAAALTRRYWKGDHFDRIRRFGHADVLADDGCLTDWIEVLLVEGIAIVTDLPDTDEALEQLANRVGIVRPCIDGYFLDIEAKPDGHSLSFTDAALEIHTDIPSEELAPGIQFLHCRANTVAGGQSLFVDGGAVAEDFRREYPDEFAILSQNDMPFYYDHDSYDLRARQRVIELDATGAVSGITLSGHMQDILDFDQRFMDRYYPALIRFHRMLQDPKYCMSFRMQEGQCLVFDNHRIAHGRSAYDGGGGRRKLRLCYLDRGEMRSRYRTLTRRRVKADVA
ncbi:MAG: TauD/TfdA family dioxygenase [Alphaproteobacteria bacterium]